ncbi:ABC transporter substrate-binding protein [Phaeobacter sp. C3_T13_0]|uniref:ABC transporter substrate-binding protein n=1 Tax=Phaeobacter cretensis TaxID=3342641 RepID=UPI0039BC7F6C
MQLFKKASIIRQIVYRIKPVTAIAALLLIFAPIAGSADPFPTVIEHIYGTTTVPAKPKRIVSLSFIGHDFLLALGERPYALRKWYGSDPYGVWVWGHDALGDAKPIVMQGEINIEQIAAMEPDLIAAQWSGITGQEYALLSQIAPTIPPRTEYGDYGSPWQDMLRRLGTATGKSSIAEATIARIEARFANLRETHPEWQGASALMAWAGHTRGYTKADIRGQFLQALGFTVQGLPEEKNHLNKFYVEFPAEDPSLMDVDALIWLDTGRNVEKLAWMPLRHTMRANREGREIYAGKLLSAALSHSSPLSLDYALDQLVPLLEAAMDGDPKTVVPGMAEAGLLPEEGF